MSTTNGSKQIVVPVFKPGEPARDSVTGFVESHGHVSMEAEHFTRRHDRGGISWQVIKGLGRSGDSVAVFPPTAGSRTEPGDIQASSPSLEYDMHVFQSGEARLDIDCLPTRHVGPGRGVRMAISIDGQEPHVLTGSGGDVLANLRRLTTTVKIAFPGKHTLTVWMVDPGIVIDKIVLDFNLPKGSYLGPPESYHR